MKPWLIGALSIVPGLERVALVRSAEGMLSDEVVIEIGEAEPLRVGVGRPMRKGTRQLVEILPR